jgi:hypothetical protein
MNQTVTSERGSVSRVRGGLKVGVLCSFAVLAAPAASTCGPPPPADITGTWAAKLVTSGKIEIPALPAVDANVEAVIRLNISVSGGNYVHKLEICKLSTPTTPNPNTLVVTYGPAMLATMVATASIPTYTAAVGGPVTIPQLVIQTGSSKVCNGSCVAADFVDSDKDNQPGVTLPANLLGLGNVDAYGALTTTINLSSATLVDANTITGNAAFATDGQVLRTNPPLVPGGSIKVTPATPSTAITAQRLAANATCSDVLALFP